MPAQARGVVPTHLIQAFVCHLLNQHNHTVTGSLHVAVDLQKWAQDVEFRFNLPAVTRTISSHASASLNRHVGAK